MLSVAVLAVSVAGCDLAAISRVSGDIVSPPDRHAHDLKVWNLGAHDDNTGAEATCDGCLRVG